MVAAACSSGTTSNTPVNGGTLIYALDADAQTLNPLEIGDVSSARASQFFFPNLYQADKNLNIVPDLADGMPAVSADGLTYTVKLRQNAKWSDGTPITADDVVATVHQQANANLDTDASFDWSPLTDPVKGVVKVDTYTVKFTLTAKFAPFLAVNLATTVLPAEVYGSLDPTKMRSDPSNQTIKVSGGPFIYTGRTPGQEIDGKANPNYYLGRPHFDALVEKIITNTTAAANALKTGDVNMDAEINGDAINTVKGLSGVNSYIYPDLAYYDVRMNDRPFRLDASGKPTKTPTLFGDVKVRQAFIYAIDHDGVVKAATGGHGTPLYGDIPPASWAYDSSATPAYPKQDVAKAKQMLKDAGWTLGSDNVLVKNGQRFVGDFCVRADKPQRVQAVTIMAQQAQAVGMDLTPKPIDFKVFYKGKANGGCGIQTGEFDLGFAGFGLGLDPDNYTTFSSTFLRPEMGPSGSNYTGFSSPELDAALIKERTDVQSTDAATKTARKADFNAVEKILHDNVVSYFMWSDNVAQGFQYKVAGIVAGGSGQDLNYADQDRNNQVYAQWYFKGGK